MVFTGRVLRDQRLRQGVRGADVARRMGVTRQRVYAIEQLALPNASVARRYLDALVAIGRERAKVERP